MEQLLADETVTGKAGAASLKANYVFTAPFRWMETSTAPGGGMGQSTPKLGTISDIDSEDKKNEDNQFMEYVFESLEPGEWGVTSSFDKSVFYVVKPLYRRVVLSEGNEPETPQSLEKLRTQFVKDLSNPTFGYGTQFFSFVSPIPQLVQFDQQRLATSWRQALEKEFEVQWGARATR